MKDGNIPKKSAEQRARLRAKKAVRRYGDHKPENATPKRKKRSQK